MRSLVAVLLLAATPAFAIDATGAGKVVLTSKSRIFADPDSVRDASIGPPFACLDGDGKCVCLEVNGRNSYGGMSGLEMIVVRLETDRAKAIGKMYKPEICGKMVPFPALNGRGR